MLLVEVCSAGTFAAHKLGNAAGSPENARVGTLASHPESPVMIGSFGQGIAIIDPVERSLTPVDLPAAPMAVRMGDGGALFVLTGDGALRRLDAATGYVHASVHVVEAVVQGQPRPSFALLGERAFVTDPANGAVWVVGLDHMKLEAHYQLPFAPGSVAVIAIQDAVIH